MSTIQAVGEGVGAVVQRHGWDLYLIQKPQEKRARGWEDIEQAGAAKQFLAEHHYVLAPLPKQGESLRTAYGNALQTKPALVLESLADHEDMRGKEALLVEERIIYSFSRIIFAEEILLCCSPRPPVSADFLSPYLEIVYRAAVQKFERHFKIISKADLGDFRRVINKPKEN